MAKAPAAGGQYWVPLHYVLGLRDRGFDAWWLEHLWAGPDPRADRARDAFLARVDEVGLRDHVVLAYFADGEPWEPRGAPELHGMDAAELRSRCADGVLVNLANSVHAPLREAFARTILLDLDPGTFQLWAAGDDEGWLGVGHHDVHLTIGANVGTEGSRIPACGVRWHTAWPPVHLPSWPVRDVAPDAPYTTVTGWWNEEWAVLDGEVLDLTKRTGFLEVLDLPRRAAAPVEIAADLHAAEVEDRALLAQHGWRLADPATVAGSPAAFRAYVQGSRGELSAAKPGYVRTAPGWISDRTVCYLASGRPCVVEATGAEERLPASAGLRFYRDVEEAAAALAEIESDYARAARAARELAEEVFSTDVALDALVRAF